MPKKRGEYIIANYLFSPQLDYLRGNNLDWVSGTKYINTDGKAVFPTIYPERCFRCFVIFLEGSDKLFERSTNTYTCFTCDLDIAWDNYFYNLRKIKIKEKYWEYIDEILSCHFAHLFNIVHNLFPDITKCL